MLESEEFLRRLHRIILDVKTIVTQTHIIEGRLICPNCTREYPIVNGIPNMILTEAEM
jgi:multifunctional methyltransferase subunit TRM112